VLATCKLWEIGLDIAEESARTIQSRLVDVQIHLGKDHCAVQRTKTTRIVIKKGIRPVSENAGNALASILQSLDQIQKS